MNSLRQRERESEVNETCTTKTSIRHIAYQPTERRLNRNSGSWRSEHSKRLRDWGGIEPEKKSSTGSPALRHQSSLLLTN